jgi:hypothetical protein
MNIAQLKIEAYQAAMDAEKAIGQDVTKESFSNVERCQLYFEQGWSLAIQAVLKLQALERSRMGK